MRAVWIALGVGLAVLVAVGWTQSLSESPHDLYVEKLDDLHLEKVAAGPKGRFSDYRSWEEEKKIEVAQITFTSRRDFRAMLLAEHWMNTTISVMPCDCFKKGAALQTRLCRRSLADIFFDDEGYIDHYNDHVSGSPRDRNGLSRYHFYVELKSRDKDDRSYDLVRRPFDLCSQIVRSSPLFSPTKSNVIEITKEQLASAISEPPDRNALSPPPFLEPNLKDPNLPDGDLSGRF